MKFKFLLGVALAASTCFSGEYTPEVKVKTLLRSEINSIGQTFQFPPNAEVHGLEVTIPPGANTGWHRHPFSGFAYVLQGELTLEIKNHPTKIYRRGEAFAESVETSHRGTAGQDTVKLAVFFFSEPGKPFTIKEILDSH